MRIDRLDLIRYGKFTGHSIDFGAKLAGGCDLHVVYGPNEAGKSTLFSAVMDLFYGIESRSPYNFLHSYPTMRIGAALTFDGRSRVVARVKRNQNSLLDGADAPLAETALQGALGGISREACRTMFSLDDETLKKGGESILASKGDLGQLLFSASAGLAGFSKALDGLKDDLAKFYTPRAGSSAFAQAKARLAELKAERTAVDVQAGEYARLADASQRAAAAYEAAAAALNALRTRQSEVQGLLAALPLQAELAAIDAELSALPEMPEPPPGAQERLSALRDKEVALRTQEQALVAEARAAAEEADAIVPDEAGLALAPQLDALTEQRGIYLKTLKDLPNRETERDEAEAEVRNLLRQLGRTGEADPRALLLSAVTSGELARLIAARSGIDAALLAAREAKLAADAALDEADGAEAEAASPLPAPAALEALASAAAVARADDHAQRLREAARRIALADGVLADALATLRPWQGGAEELAALTPPSAADVAAAGAALATAEQAAAAQAQTLERAETELHRQSAALAALGDPRTLADGADHAAVRAARETLWAAHRKALDAASAEAFEIALRRDDAATAARLSQAADIARMSQLREATAVARAEQERSAALMETIAGRVTAARRALSALAGATSPQLPADMSAAALTAWLERRTAALAARSERRAAEVQQREAEADGGRIRATLAAALAAAGRPPPDAAALPVLLAAADAVAIHAAGAAARRGGRERLERDAAIRAHALAQAEAAAAEWTDRWARLLEENWIGRIAPPPSPAAVGTILNTLLKLEAALRSLDEHSIRLDKMLRDKADFAATVMAAADALELDGATEEPLQVLHAVTQRAVAARKLADRLEMLRERARTAEAALAALTQARAAHAAEAAAFCQALGVADLAAAGPGLEAAAGRARLRHAQDDKRRALLATLGVGSPAEAAARLAGADPAALKAEAADAALRLPDLEQARQQAFADRRDAVAKLDAVAGDAEAALLEARRATLLTELADESLRYLRLSLGAVAVERGLRAYREAHRSSMMKAASDAFAIISRGAYAGLSTQLVDGKDTLIALAADGTSKVSDTLSKGTLFQLYLALRVAGYREFARERAPLPFICDDIMETFDDFRAEEAFRLLAGMAEHGQVIYLTHHRHLCAIARDACPHVQVHELPGA